MRVHFFSRTDLDSRSDFRMYYILQNLNTAQTFSVIYFFLSVVTRIILVVSGKYVNSVTHFEEYDLSNMIALIANPVFYILSSQLRRLFETDKKYANAAQFVVFLFAFFIVFNSMRASFYMMHNPRNTLVFYLIGLVLAGMFFTFEFYGNLAFTLLTGACFAIMLTFYQHGFDELFINNLVSLILLTIFFAISRYSFSYRADNFFKIKAIEEKNLVIEKASQVKNEILGVVAHDLRNPLAAIKVIATLMEEEKDISADNRDNLQMIKTSCERATSIINDLLETAHNEIGNEFDLAPVELNKFLLKIVDEWLKNKQDKVNILFYGTKQPVYALINKEKIHRAMDNLVSNAVKFSGESEHIEISLKELNGEAIITIRDFGVGIPAAILPYVFDRFSKASRRGIRGEESIGLGLSIVRQIIEKHNGEINVESVENKGTIFTISLRSGIVGS